MTLGERIKAWAVRNGLNDQKLAELALLKSINDLVREIRRTRRRSRELQEDDDDA